jgi:hypothetical protein
MTIPNVPGGGTIAVRYHEPGLDAFIAISLAAFAVIAGALLAGENQRRRTPKL